MYYHGLSYYWIKGQFPLGRYPPDSIGNVDSTRWNLHFQQNLVCDGVRPPTWKLTLRAPRRQVIHLRNGLNAGRAGPGRVARAHCGAPLSPRHEARLQLFLRVLFCTFHYRSRFDNHNHSIIALSSFHTSLATLLLRFQIRNVVSHRYNSTAAINHVSNTQFCNARQQ